MNKNRLTFSRGIFYQLLQRPIKSCRELCFNYCPLNNSRV